MSFSSEVKEELFNHMGKSRHCQIAEMAAIMAWESDNSLTDDGLIPYRHSKKGA